MSRRSLRRATKTWNSISKATKPIGRLAESVANQPSKLLSTASRTVQSVSSNLSMPLLLIGAAGLFFVLQNRR